MEPTFFATPAGFRAWLEQNHESAPELLVGYYKKGTGRPSITWPESVDEALCFGWIDGIRRARDLESYTIRFTPRRRGSNWSTVNLNRMEELIRDGRMHPAGLRAYEARDPAKCGVYSYEGSTVAELTPEMVARFQARGAAWSFFQAQPPGYRKLMVRWVFSAKRDETRQRRLATLIEESAAGRRISPMGPRPSQGDGQ